MKRSMCALLVLLLLAACSAGDDPTTSAGEGRSDTSASPEPSDDEREGNKGDGRRRSDDGEPGRDAKDAGKKRGGSEDEADGGNVFNDASEDDGSSAVYPAAGRYLYRQSGFERFCQATRCEDQALPATQPIHVSLREPSPDRAVVVSEIEASGNRTVRTTSTFTRRSALVTEVYARFSYEGFTFENTYRPEPPVESLRFPLSEGDSWSGRWKDSTSGDYAIDVLEVEEVSVGGAAINAFKLSSVTNFEGEFEGTAKALIWVDPSTKVVVKTTGRLDLRSAFGRYITEFSNALRSGPGY